MGFSRSVAAFVLGSAVAACAAGSTPSTTSADLTADGGACTPIAPRPTPIQLAVWPEAGEAAITAPLGEAQHSIRLMVYMLGMDGAFAVLKAKATAGVDVRVILDGGKQRSFNTRAFNALTQAGVQVKWSDPKFAFMHAKSFVVDDHIAIVSTGNFPKGLVGDERNYVARDEDPADVATIAGVFDADWAGTDPDLACTRLLVSPTSSKDRLLALITGATSSLLVESLELSDADVIAAILARKRAGLDVRVLLADPAWDGSGNNARTAAKLDAQQVPTRMIPKARMLVHVKSILVDGERAYMGSENLTTGSLVKNREIGLVVTDAPAVGTMTATFESDFASATTL